MLEGKAAVVRQMQDILTNANNGKGWQDLLVKTSIDLYTQDNGAFWEIVRAGNKPDGVVIGLNHLDSMECWHTGDPLKPVVYRDTNGEYHLLPWYSVVELSELPAPVERLYGIQLCALTRLLRAAEIIKNITTYEQEKTGGRFQRAVHLVKGISTSEINDALKQVSTMADNAGLVRYIQPLVVGSIDPKADIGHDTIELASMPDNFSKETEIKLYITIVAMAFLSDYQDFAPLPGGNLGTSTQSEVLHMKSRGRGPALFMGLIANALNFQVLPKAVQFKFAEQDLEADQAQADIRNKRAETRKLEVESGVLTVPAARQQALDKGDISPEIFEILGAQDLTPSETLRSGERPDGGKTVRFTKQEVNYREAGFYDRSLCENCRFFEPVRATIEDGIGGCERVQGIIRVQDTCDIWESRESYGDAGGGRKKRPYKAGDKQEVRKGKKPSRSLREGKLLIRESFALRRRNA